MDQPTATEEVGDDRALLAAWVERRDEAAFSRLVERNRILVESLCRRELRSLHDPAEAEDVVQEVFIASRFAMLVGLPGPTGLRMPAPCWRLRPCIHPTISVQPLVGFLLNL